MATRSFAPRQLQWVGDKLEHAGQAGAADAHRLRTGIQYRESRTVGSEEQANEPNEKAASRARAAIAEGKITLEAVR